MKFRNLFAGILSLGMLFCGSMYAADSNIKIYDYSTNRTFNHEVIWYGSYTQSLAAGEHYSGSTTTHGGTSTFSNGCVNVDHIADDIEFIITAFPNGVDGGSGTVNFYGVYGTTTAGAGSLTTKGCALLRAAVAVNAPASLAPSGTSTIITLTNIPTLIAVGVDVTAGTVTWNISSNSKEAR